jgi:hypothetical protein
LSAPIRLGIKPGAPAGNFHTFGTARAFELALASATNGAFRLEASTNLVDWISLGSIETVSNALYYADPSATNHVRRFYRAVKQH